jgi:type II secretory pathway pseudopilin PulG
MTGGKTREQGFTYLAVLISLGFMGAALAASAELWSHAAQREKERELLFVGDQYRQAIASYYEKTPGPVKRYPERLEDLLEDKRQPGVHRHLRKPYVDPITGSSSWGTVAAPMGGIMGVYSMSEDTPIKTGNFSQRDAAFEDSAQYSAWQFVYAPKPPPAAAPPAAPPAKPAP